MLLLKRVTVYAPEKLGVRDVLVGGEEILAISESPMDVGTLPVDVIDGENRILVPGFIDGHVHICGGGGEGGFKTRTPELRMTEMIEAGVTTVVGCLGTDGITRNMENLVAKVYGLREEGVSAYCYTGSYQVPVRTLTGDIMKDLMMVDPIIGVGEIALNDHRSSAPTVDELARLAASARVGGILSGKAGVVNCHLGDGPQDLELIDRVLEEQVLPVTQFYPTHINRNPRLFEKGIEHAKNGGYVDMTTSTTPQFIEEGEVPASLGLKRMLDAGVPIDQITFTSDGHGSLPMFNEAGEFSGLGIGRLSTLIESFREAVQVHGLPVEVALRPITSNPARILKLKRKGHIATGMDADMVLLDGETLEITEVIVRGRLGMTNSKLMVSDTISDL